MDRLDSAVFYVEKPNYFFLFLQGIVYFSVDTIHAILKKDFLANALLCFSLGGNWRERGGFLSLFCFLIALFFISVCYRGARK